MQISAPVAQWIELTASIGPVRGSNPLGGTMIYKHIQNALRGFIYGALGLFLLELLLVALKSWLEGGPDLSIYFIELLRVALVVWIFSRTRSVLAVGGVSLGFAFVEAVVSFILLGYINEWALLAQFIIGGLSMLLFNHYTFNYLIFTLPLLLLATITISTWFMKLAYWWALLTR